MLQLSLLLRMHLFGGLQERFHSLTTSFFKRAEGFVLVFDISDRQSFDCIARWMGDIAEQGKQDCDVMLCGNKCDVKERAVTQPEAQQLAQKYKVSDITSERRMTT